MFPRPKLEQLPQSAARPSIGHRESSIEHPASGILNLLYCAHVTWRFLNLLLFLRGFTLVLVSGLFRRILHPSELCGDAMLPPSQEHWQPAHAPRADLLIVFITVFGLATLVELVDSPDVVATVRPRAS